MSQEIVEWACDSRSQTQLVVTLRTACRRLSRIAVVSCFMFGGITAPLLAPHSAAAQNYSATSRVVEGKVYGVSGSAQSGAVVYLKNQKTLEIKTYITTQDGTFRFVQLGAQEDYLLWAEVAGHKSKNKTVSSFDSKKTFDIALHIEEKLTENK